MCNIFEHRLRIKKNQTLFLSGTLRHRMFQEQSLGGQNMLQCPKNRQTFQRVFAPDRTARKTRKQPTRSTKHRKHGRTAKDFGERRHAAARNETTQGGGEIGECTHRPTTAKEAVSQATPRQAQWSRPPSQSTSALAAFPNPAFTAISARPSPPPPPPASTAAAARTSTAAAADHHHGSSAIPRSPLEGTSRSLVPPSPQSHHLSGNSQPGPRSPGHHRCELVAAASTGTSAAAPCPCDGQEGGGVGLGVRRGLRAMRFCGGAGDGDVTVVAFGGKPLLLHCAQ